MISRGAIKDDPKTFKLFKSDIPIITYIFISIPTTAMHIKTSNGIFDPLLVPTSIPNINIGIRATSQ